MEEKADGRRKTQAGQKESEMIAGKGRKEGGGGDEVRMGKYGGWGTCVRKALEGGGQGVERGRRALCQSSKIVVVT